MLAVQAGYAGYPGWLVKLASLLCCLGWLAGNIYWLCCPDFWLDFLATLVVWLVMLAMLFSGIL